MKFVGGGITHRLVDLSPNICGRLWRELDIVPLVFNVRSTQRLAPGRPAPKTDSLGFPVTPSGLLTPQDNNSQQPGNGLLSVAVANVVSDAQKEKAQTASPPTRTADEQADSAVRKAVLYFGPSGHHPRLSIGFR